MEMHQLRYFLAVIKTGSFSRAAVECHVSQPSLSQQILKLEEELGESLFERLPRGVALTPAAHQLKKSAERILTEVDTARRRVQQASGDVRGRVVIGALPTIAPYLLPRVLKAFAAHYPHAEVVVQEDTTARLLVGIDTAQVDLAVLSLPVEAPFLRTRALFEDELLLAVPPGHRLATVQAPTVDDLREEDFILLHEGHCLADQALDLCARGEDHVLRVSCRSAQMETVEAMIRSGLGISLVPRMACTADEPRGLVLRSLAPRVHRTVALAWRKNRHQCLVSRAFYECLVAADAWSGQPAPHSALEAMSLGRPALSMPAFGRS